MRTRLIIILLLAAALGCSVPPALTPTPTGLPVTPANLPLADTAGDQTTAPAATAYVPWATIQPEALAHRVAIRQLYGLGEFYDQQSGLKFTPRGVNYQPTGDLGRTADDFRRLSALGYNTVRVIFDACTGRWDCITPTGGEGLELGALDHMTAVLRAAKERNLVLLLASAGLPEGSSYAAQANQGGSEQFGGERNIGLLTPQGVAAYRSYWGDLLSGLAARGAPLDVVLGWELLAEAWYAGDQPPFSLAEGEVTGANGTSYDLAEPATKQALAVEGLTYFSAELRHVIASHDINGLVGMGFLAPDTPNPGREGDARYVETAELLTSDALDFYELHLDMDTALTLAETAQNFGLERRISAPLLMGEFSASSWAHTTVEAAAAAVQDWIAASCAYGLDGWLYGSYASNPYVWSFTDGDGFLMAVIAPHSQPEACSTTVLPGRNLALGQAVSVSAALPDQPPEQAVDGTDAQWSAGGFAEQWLSIDLGAPYTIGSIRLLVGQWPAGQTVHQLFAAGADGEWRLLAELRGYTRDYDLLEYVPPEPLREVQYIRVITLESLSWVSWREIEVLAPLRPTPTVEVEASVTPETTP